MSIQDWSAVASTSEDGHRISGISSGISKIVGSCLVFGGCTDRVRVLKPGGWVQLVDYYYMCQSDNGSIDDTSALRQWSSNYIRALDATKDPRSALQLQGIFTAAGLVDVETRMIPLPLCGWSNSKIRSAWFRSNWVPLSDTPRPGISICSRRTDVHYRGCVVLMFSNRSTGTADWYCKRSHHTTSAGQFVSFPIYTAPGHGH